DVAWLWWLDDLAATKLHAEVGGGLAASGGRRREPHDGGHHDEVGDDRDQALPEKDGVGEPDDAPGDKANMRKQFADRRLKRTGRGHLQRRRSAQPLRPDTARAEKARGRKRTIVDVFDTTRDFDREDRTEDKAESPVDP